MRGMIFALPLLSLAACNVSKDDGNDSVTVQYDQNTAENAVANAGNFADNVGGAIANDASKAADKVQNKVGEADVDVDANRNSAGNSH